MSMSHTQQRSPDQRTCACATARQGRWANSSESSDTRPSAQHLPCPALHAGCCLGKALQHIQSTCLCTSREQLDDAQPSRPTLLLSTKTGQTIVSTTTVHPAAQSYKHSAVQTLMGVKLPVAASSQGVKGARGMSDAASPAITRAVYDPRGVGTPASPPEPCEGER